MGLADRDYMRDEARSWRWSASVMLMVVITAAFILQQFAEAYARQNFNVPEHHTDAVQVSHALNLLALNAGDLAHGYLWQLLTFQFLHAGFWHLLGNLVGIWFFGRYVETRLGNLNLLKIYFASGVAGGLLQAVLGLLFPGHFGSSVVGASAGVVGLFAAFATLEPEVQILLWFVLPVKARHLLYGSIGIAVFFLVVPVETVVAHGAHLGGLLTGIAFIHWRLYERRYRSQPAPFAQVRRRWELVSAQYASSKQRGRPPEPDADLPPEEFISREVDPILDKISAHGIQSLTDRERKILDAARKKMERR